jgi:hypothetical protein
MPRLLFQRQLAVPQVPVFEVDGELDDAFAAASHDSSGRSCSRSG